MVAVGLYIGGNTLGGIGGRLIGGFVGEWMGRSAAFAAMAGISLVFLIAFIVLLPASKQFESKPLKWSIIVSNMLGHLSNRRLVTAYVIGGLSFFVFINQYSYITFRLESKPYQLSSQYIGLLFLTYLAGTVGSAVSGRLVQRLAQPYLMVIGTLIFMLGSIITLSARLEIILCGLAINCFGFFLCHSTASSFVSRNAKYAKASASSLYLVGYYLGGSMGGYYLDPFWRADQWQGVIIGSLIVLGIVVLAGASLFWCVNLITREDVNKSSCLSNCPLNYL